MMLLSFINKLDDCRLGHRHHACLELSVDYALILAYY